MKKKNFPPRSSFRVGLVNFSPKMKIWKACFLGIVEFLWLSSRTGCNKKSNFRIVRTVVWYILENKILNLKPIYFTIYFKYCMSLRLYLYILYTQLGRTVALAKNNSTVRSSINFSKFLRYILLSNKFSFRSIFFEVHKQTKYQASRICLLFWKAACESSRVLIFYTPPNFQFNENFP